MSYLFFYSKVQVFGKTLMHEFHLHIAILNGTSYLCPAQTAQMVKTFKNWVLNYTKNLLSVGLVSCFLYPKTAKILSDEINMSFWSHQASYLIRIAVYYICFISLIWNYSWICLIHTLLVHALLRSYICSAEVMYMLCRGLVHALQRSYTYSAEVIYMLCRDPVYALQRSYILCRGHIHALQRSCVCSAVVMIICYQGPM